MTTKNALPTFVTGSGELFRPVDAAQVERLRGLGLKEATAGETHHEELRKQYSSWMYAPVAATLGAVHSALPGATGAALTGLDALSHGTAQGAADVIEGVQVGNPVSYGGGVLAGAVAPAVANVAGGLLAGPAGAAAVGAGSFMGMTFDDLALKHINTPEGAEKTAVALAESGVMGAGLGLAGFGVAAWIGKKGLSVMGSKLEASGEKLLAKETEVGNPGVQARLEETRSVEVTNDLIQKYDLLGKGKAGVQQTLTRIASKAEKAMEEAKLVTTETLDMADQVAFKNQIRAQLAGVGGLEEVIGAEAKAAPKVGGYGSFPTGEPDKAIKSALALDQPQTVSELHALRQKFDAKVNWEEATSPLSQRMIAARDLVDEQITKTFQKAAEVSDSDLTLGQLSRWQSANADYAGSKALQDALKYSEATGQSFIQKASSWAGKAGIGTAIAGAWHGNIPAVAGGTATWAASKAFGQSGTLAAQAVRGVGKMMQAFDGSFVGAVLGTTSGSAITRTVAAAGALGLSDYTLAAATVTHATEDPAATVQGMAKDLAGKKVPGAIVDVVVPQQVRAAQYLNSVVPKSPWTGATVAPTAWQPSLKQRAEFLETANAISDPLAAFANPSARKMEAIKAVYPVMHQQGAMIAAQYAAARPDLSLRERRRLALITGMPATPLASPQAQAIMAQVNAAAQQMLAHVGQGAQPRRRGAATGEMVSASDTQLGRMAGK